MTLNPDLPVIFTDLEVIQHGAQSFRWSFTDDDGNPINLSGKTVAFRAAAADSVVLIDYVDGDGHLTVSGDDSNIVTIVFNSNDTQVSPLLLTYMIWASDFIPLAGGSLSFKMAVSP